MPWNNDAARWMREAFERGFEAMHRVPPTTGQIESSARAKFDTAVHIAWRSLRSPEDFEPMFLRVGESPWQVVGDSGACQVNMPASSLTVLLRCGPRMLAQHRVELNVVRPAIRTFMAQKPTADKPAELELYVDDALEIEIELAGIRHPAGPRSVVQIAGQNVDQTMHVIAHGVANTLARSSLVIPAIAVAANRYDAALKHALRRA
jgi:hypothetical protein